MKLHYSNILLFFFPLNIFLTSYHANTHKNPSITPHHTRITTSRMLSECDTQSSIYDKDAHMKSVMQQFDDRTSERLREYDERMQDKRQKHKEQRDKNIQEIVKKDKMDKSLAEKVEKGCLRCGCGLGGVAASVGLFGGLGIYGWKTTATTAAVAAAKKAAAAKGAAEGIQKLISGLQQGFGIQDLYKTPLEKFITAETYCNADLIADGVKVYYQTLCATDPTCGSNSMFMHYKSMGELKGTRAVVEAATRIVREGVDKASEETVKATAIEMTSLEAGKLEKIVETSYYSYSAIGYSVLAILIIVLIMMIIYLVLRYRRKKKMNKKAQYTKLLKE
ncbi:rifin PIR protein, putative [Plasmodium reichenowi]|uniref:Rifin PIR protein, putative n=1 Tax=Plasmodium reichenowi TaxID=5854 RepID=A0A2P9DC97_PLARE|nr:rifin PIR protein, putative [Plasmodium reichenowi]